MSILRSGPARPAVTITVAVLLAGCQSYQPHPINLAGHHRSWVARSGNDATVQAFVDRLAGAGRATGLGVDPGDGLSLAEAELVALVYNPDLRLARLRVGVARATAEYAGRWDDPTLSVDVLRITESVPDPWVVTPGLTVTIPLSGRLAIEQDRADAALRAEVAAVAEQEWAVRWALQEAWLAWSAASIQFAEQAHLLDDIAVRACRHIETALDVRRDAVSREYRYYILNRAAPSALKRQRAAFVPGELDIAAMNKAGAALRGERNFASFASRLSRSNVRRMVRTMHRAEVRRHGEMVIFTAVANSFLPHQVRNTAGALIRLGLGRMTPGEFYSIIEAAKPGLAGPAAPAGGLYLERVNYPAPIEEIIYENL